MKQLLMLADPGLLSVIRSRVSVAPKQITDSSGHAA